MGGHRVFTLTPREVFRSLTTIVGVLLAAHGIAHIIYYASGEAPLARPLIALFNVGRDGNLPTVYSFLSMFLAAGMLAVIATSEMRVRGPSTQHRYWWGLTLIFAFLACDESIELHERLIVPGRELFNLSGMFYYAWVIPYGIFALLVFALYLRFLMKLPRHIAWLFVLAGGMYVAGALGMEMVGGWYWEQYLIGEHTAAQARTMVMIQTIEEALEMMGIVVFIYALARYVSDKGGLAITIRRGEES
jgi:hypothetical protein